MLPYLDVLINNNNNVQFKLEVYCKLTKNKLVLNEKGKCPKRYKESVINSFHIEKNMVCSTEEQTNLIY